MADEKVKQFWTRCASGTEESVQELLKDNVPVDSADADGRTGLMLAADKGLLPIVQLLAANGAGVNTVRLNGQTALMMAARKGHDTVVRALIELGADVNLVDNSGMTAASWASLTGKLDALKVLTENGAALTGDLVNKGPPLLWACMNEHIEVIRYLLDNGANVNEARASDGMTPLMWAGLRGNTTIARVLISKGADPKAQRSTDGMTALEWAVSKDHSDAVALFREHSEWPDHPVSISDELALEMVCQNDVPKPRDRATEDLVKAYLAFTTTDSDIENVFLKNAVDKDQNILRAAGDAFGHLRPAFLTPATEGDEGAQNTVHAGHVATARNTMVSIASRGTTGPLSVLQGRPDLVDIACGYSVRRITAPRE